MKNKGKCEKGYTAVDVTLAMFIIILFVSIMTSIMYSIYTSSTEARRKAEAINYSVAVFEKVGQLSYLALDGSDVLQSIPKITGVKKVNENETIGYIGGDADNYQFKFTLTVEEKHPREMKEVTLNISYRVKAGANGLRDIEFTRLKTIEIS